MFKTLRCFARGYDGKYEAICIDLDISVVAGSLQEAQRCLNEAVEMYVHAAIEERPEVAKKLLSRRAPWHVRMGWIWSFALHMMISRPAGHDRTMHAGYEMACPA
ncbi:hypothetical protein [Brevundimonas sp.]|uniref:hypothetical protein n=1 Tax=Brevundimonas sp. TaxID=1871086 RepID=UPI00289FA03E|nr:hypothetical protein [Brevundimonas sp.]